MEEIDLKIRNRLTRSLSPAKLLASFNPQPSEDLQTRVDYYFKPYSPATFKNKFMHFETDPDKFILGQINHILLSETSLSFSQRREITDFVDLL